MSERKVILVELDFPERKWSSSELEAELLLLMPDRRPVVFGAISGAEVDAAYRKLRQLSRETEENDTEANRIHSAHKALSFFRDMLPDRYWKWFEIGVPHSQRQRHLATPKQLGDKS